MKQRRYINCRKLISRVSLILFLVLLVLNFLVKKDKKTGFNADIASLFGFASSSEFDVIKQDINKNYSGVRTG